MLEMETSVARGSAEECAIAAGVSFSTYLRSHGLVHRSPPHVLLRAFLFHYPFVGRRSSGLGSRVGGEGAGGGHGRAGLVDESIFVEGRNRGVGNLVRRIR